MNTVVGEDDIKFAADLAIAGQRDEAAAVLLNQIDSDRGSKGALSSLGFLISAGLTTFTLTRCWEALERHREAGLSELIERGRFLHFSLLVEIALAIDPDWAIRAIEDVYLPYMQANEILRRRGDRTIFFWHVPKCGGTAFNSCLANHFYKSGTAFLPSYLAKGFHRALSSAYHRDLPYLASSHIDLHDTALPDRSDVYQVLAVRSPKARAISAWRQYYAGLERRNSIYQHNAVWKFWPKAGLAEWARRVPAGVANRQCFTFSMDGDIAIAAQNVSRIDLVFDIGDMETSASRVATEMNLQLDLQGLGTRKNVTDKSIEIDEQDLHSLDRAVDIDRTFLRAIGMPST